MNGVGTLLGILGRSQRWRVLVWVVALVGSLGGTALSIAALYDTQAEIDSYANAVVSDALIAINGEVEGIATLGGIIQDEFGFMAAFLMPLVGISLVASTTRGEEDSGRLEALLAGRIDRRAPVVASLLLVAGAVLVIVVGFVLSLLAAGIDPGPAVLYAAALGSVTLVFAGVAAVSAQVVLHSRGVYALGFLVLGASYLLRGVGDVTDTFWVWLSPLGWMEKTAPFAAEQRWWALALPLAAAAVLSATAVALAARRDLGASLRRPGAGPDAASRWLVRPVGLASAVQLRSFAGWLTGAVVLAAVMGALAQEVADAALGNPALSDALGITEQNAADGFLALVQVYLAILACGYVVQSVGTMRREEVQGRLEPVLAGALSRPRWLGAQLAVVGGGLVVLLVLSSGTLGAATALSTGESGYVGTALGAGLAYLPAVLVVAAVAAALFGRVPRAFAVAWAGFGLVAAIGLLGPGLQMPQWMLDLSPLTHVGNPPEGSVDAVPLAALAAVAVVVTAAAFAGFRARRIPQG